MGLKKKKKEDRKKERKTDRGRFAVAKFGSDCTLGVWSRPKKTNKRRQWDREEFTSQAVMDVAGCRHSAERANYVDFGETSEQTAPRLHPSPSPLPHPTAQLHTTATPTPDCGGINLSPSGPSRARKLQPDASENTRMLCLRFVIKMFDADPHWSGQ